MTPQTELADEVAVAETDMARQEAALDAEVARLKALRREANEHLTRAKTQAEEPTLVAQLSTLTVPSATVKTHVDEARMARLKALATRKGALETARQVMKTYEHELDRVFDMVHDAETAAKQRQVQKSAAIAEVKAKEAAAAAAVRAPVPVESEDSLAAAMSRAIDEQKLPVAQRRAVPRVALCAEITLGSDSNFFTGFTNDVSEGGVFVATVNVLPLGTQIDLAFSLPNGPRIEGKGEVRWVREYDERNPDSFPGMGIRFLDIPLPSVGAIHAFTAQREPMFFPEA